MPRIKMLSERTDLPADQHAEYDAIVEVLSGVRGPFCVLLHSPGLARKVMEAGAHVRLRSTLSKSDREIAILTLSRERNASYEWVTHSKAARAAGVSESTIEAIRLCEPLEMLELDERDIVNLVRQLHRANKVDEELFERLRGRHGDRWLVELVATVGQYEYIVTLTSAFDVEGPPETFIC